MADRKILDIYNRRFFEIPKYQRGFAWEKEQIIDLYEDINEAIETGSNHYIGTLVLSQIPNKEDHYYIVDGQQRITTITMLVNEIIKHFSRKDRDYYRRFYIAEEKGVLRLKTLGKDNQYLSNILKGKVGQPQNKSQRNLKEASEEIQTIANNIEDKKGFLNYIEKLEVMEFIEKSEGDAIRIFQTVNDRGKDLSNMEKAKSLLIYFSNRYLEKKLDDRINDVFGDIFEIYDDIKHIGETEGIELISSKDFNEDNIMRYHFVSFSDENYDATAPFVLRFLKRKLADCRDEFRNDKENGLQNMENLIRDYIESLHDFFTALLNILLRIYKDQKYYKIFVILQLSATLYPAMVKLEMLGKLDEKLCGEEFANYKLIDLIELIEVRVYKTRQTDPRAEISRFACYLNASWENKRIQDRLLEYNRAWMSSATFEAELNSNIYGNQALPHIFIEYCEFLRKKMFTLDQLREIASKKPTTEHILSKTPKFTYKSVGFKSGQDFEEYVGRLGNLTILEKKLNSAAQNKMPIEKVEHYDKSLYKITKDIASSLSIDGKFTRTNIDDRTKELSKYIMTRWWC